MANIVSNSVNRIADYCTRIADANPSEALQIALAEAERERALAATAQAEYKALAEVEFDSEGRISTANLAGLWRLAQMYAGSMMVPEHYRGKPHDCFIACEMAFRLRVAVFAYMQMSYVVHGRPGIEAKLAVAMLNTSGAIKGRVRYKLEGSGKTRSCTAMATDAETGETVDMTIDWAMVEAEGWAGKSGSKWRTMPDVMFRYRSAVFLIRQFYPEVMMGMRTTDELEDIAEEAPPARNLAELSVRIEGPSNGNGTPKPMGIGEIPLDTPDEPEEADPEGVNETLLAQVREEFSRASDVDGVAFVCGEIIDHSQPNDATVTAIKAAAEQRKAELNPLPAPGRKQKTL